MLFRREGLIPATRLTPALSIEAQQRAEVRRGGFVGLERIGRWERRAAGTRWKFAASP